MSLTARTTAHRSRDSLHLTAHLRRTNAEILLVCFPRHLLSRVPEHLYLARGMVAQFHSHESAALSAPALVHGIPARALTQAAVGVQDTIHSHVSVSGASLLVLGRARAHSLIQDDGGAFRSSTELVPGPIYAKSSASH